MTDFASLKKKRDASIRRIAADFFQSEVYYHASHIDACYCACPDGPCEHEWSGWREFKGGGEQVCQKCGVGAMSHSMRVGP